MKYHLVLWLCLSLLLGPVRAADPAPAAVQPVRILTSFYPIYLATLNVAHDVPGVEVVNLTPPLTGCLHDYQATPSDLRRIASAQVFVVNGAGMEAFLDKAVQQSPGLHVVNASAGITLLKGPGDSGDNPHVWVSPTLAIKQVQNIAAGLARHDAAHAALYQQNAAAYVAQLEALCQRMHDGLKTLKTRDIVTFHEAFPYFAQEFDLRIVAVVEREPGSQPSARELGETVALIRKSGIKALFAEPQYPAKAGEVIARETGATVYTLDPVVTGPLARGAYLALMEQNLKTLQAALQ